MSFRDRFFTQGVARAITSPSAILATGAGAAAGVLVGLGPIGAVALGAAAFGARVLAAVPRKKPSERPVGDPRGLTQPWRGAMEQVIDSRRRFDRAIGTLEPGPLHDRLDSVADRLDVAVHEAWRIAQAGDLLTNGRKQIDTTGISAELTAAQQAPSTPRTRRR